MVVGPWWKPKATNLFSVLFATVLVTGLPFGRALFFFVPSLLTILGIGMFGHLVNDLYDVEADAAVEKPNRLASMPGWRRRAFVAGALALGLCPWLILPCDAPSLALLSLEFALLLAYAVPPLRLKERTVWPILADAAYAYAIPAVLASHTFFLASRAPSRGPFLGALLVWQLGLGVRHFLNHLAIDRVNDLETGTPTLATEKGNAFIHALIRRFVLPVELSGFWMFLVVVGSPKWLLPGIVACVLLLRSAVYVAVTVGRRGPWPPYRFSRVNLDWLYQDVLPIVLLGFLIASDQRFLLVPAALFVVVAGRVGPGIGAEVLRWAATLWPASPSPSYATTRPTSQGCARAAQTAVAVVNINKLKYTETFVHGSLARLRYRVHYLYGGELPCFDDAGRHFLSTWPSMQTLAHLLEKALRVGPDHFLQNSIARYLRVHEVRLILAHFGPVGVRMLPIARDLGIPLVVCFHGYDAFHGNIVRQYEKEYRTLFREAHRIIAVSELMMRRLRALGARCEKLVHLPAFVDLERFAPVDHSALPPNFLAVGRFAETKSPHLTILAFHRVAQRIPEARLTIVGKGGGGELHEACVILVRSLGLEDRVQLAGVLPHEEVAMEMRRARVFVQHSVTAPETDDMEGKPVAVMEAMASGLPVVTTRHSGIVELIEDGVTGLLVDEYDFEAMAEAMLRLAHDDELVWRIGRNASSRIRGDPLIRNHAEILEEVVDAGIARGG
jgi:glycosyltransferase involved in cell wall biosynthesis